MLMHPYISSFFISLVYSVLVHQPSTRLTLHTVRRPWHHHIQWLLERDKARARPQTLSPQVRAPRLTTRVQMAVAGMAIAMVDKP
jgi:hypothetical protein